MRRLSLLMSDEFYQKSYAESLLGSIAEKTPLELLWAQPRAVTRNRLVKPRATTLMPAALGVVGCHRSVVALSTAVPPALGFRWLPLLTLFHFLGTSLISNSL